MCLTCKLVKERGGTVFKSKPFEIKALPDCSTALQPIKFYNLPILYNKTQSSIPVGEGYKSFFKINTDNKCPL